MKDMKKLIIDFIKKEYLDEADDTEITDTTPLISGGIVDSFSMVSLKTFLEKQYAIQIPDSKVTPEAFDTVNGIVSLVNELRGEAGQTSA
ncbi:MAG: acyl carrier protein [bacterium]|jgi:acyl carrier protein|nr:acyl carrier protein [candidate division KSB1 bacterium]MDH7558823.1 acyl carrier protein [bacterium]